MPRLPGPRLFRRSFAPGICRRRFGPRATDARSDRDPRSAEVTQHAEVSRPVRTHRSRPFRRRMIAVRRRPPSTPRSCAALPAARFADSAAATDFAPAPTAPRPRRRRGRAPHAPRSAAAAPFAAARPSAPAPRRRRRLGPATAPPGPPPCRESRDVREAPVPAGLLPHPAGAPIIPPAGVVPAAVPVSRSALIAATMELACE